MVLRGFKEEREVLITLVELSELFAHCILGMSVSQHSLRFSLYKLEVWVEYEIVAKQFDVQVLAKSSHGYAAMAIQGLLLLS